MKSHMKFTFTALLAMLVGIAGLTRLGAKDEKKPDPAPAEEAKAVKPKPLSEQAKKGLAYLVSQQHENGGWGQGGGWRIGNEGGGRVEGKEVKDPPDMANTCIATLALLRSGSTAKEGPYAKNITKALDFIFNKVEKADKESLYVTDVRNTQIQSKIGPYADTFLAALVLAEMKDKMPDARGEKRLIAALDKTVNKIEINQKADGTFKGNQGWATVLSQGLASKGLNRIAQVGGSVKGETLERAQIADGAGLDKASGDFKAVALAPVAAPALPTAPAAAAVVTAPSALPDRTLTKPAAPAVVTAPVPPTVPTGPSTKPTVAARPPVAESTAPSSDAGVYLYRGANQAGGLQDAVNTLRLKEKQNRAIVESPTEPKARKEEAKKDIARLQKAEEESAAAVRGLAKKLDDKQFIAGFGNNGGEEFLSHMNISETLLAKGGKEWEAWDKKMTEGLTKAQDKDGAWSGQHCITGRTFCTSAALLVLMADRAPVPVAAKMKGGK